MHSSMRERRSDRSRTGAKTRRENGGLSDKFG